MPLQGQYLGMELYVDDTDLENHAFFEHCGRHELRLQRWQSNGLLSFPPGTANPWDGTPEHAWDRVEGKGTVVSYCEVHHPILPAFHETVRKYAIHRSRYPGYARLLERCESGARA